MCSLISTTSSLPQLQNFKLPTISFSWTLLSVYALKGLIWILHQSNTQCDKSVTSWSSHKRRSYYPGQDKHVKPIARKFVLTPTVSALGSNGCHLLWEVWCTPTWGVMNQNSTYVFYCVVSMFWWVSGGEASWIDRNETKGGHWMEKQITS